jgi:hypothetical protein
MTKSSKLMISVTVRCMTNPNGTVQNRLERRKMRTRAALIRAAQTFVAAGKFNVPVLEITQAADVKPDEVTQLQRSHRVTRTERHPRVDVSNMRTAPIR